MAKSAAVWGIDIGRCALKALRCHVDGDSVVADGFDYIEYPKLLTQPEADAPQLIKEALEQFLTRNNVKGDRVAIAVSGESGLARYFKPPPVDVKKIADIVKYEARQQIPFALEDVIWDYQRMAGGQEVDGFALDTEIGLFAMKREQVAKALAPYNTAGIEVDFIQLAPIAIYNYVAFDITKELPEGEEYNSDSPPPSMIVLSIGTDTTDLVVTNGYRVWQRNIPLGGNHFTKQLSKELKLTFAKAEHLKRNPKQAEDPKAIFQAMRPVFADMVTEVQRSVGFFQSLDRRAKITGAVMLGNTVKLPGLIQYLGKHLGYEVHEVDSYNKLGGASVVAAPSFKDNVLAFSTCYGLCLQGLAKAKLATNLLPREIHTQRLIRAKKPWALAGVSALVLACALNYGFYVSTWKKVDPNTTVDGTPWSQALTDAKGLVDKSTGLIAQDTAKVAELDRLKKIGQEVVGSVDRRVLWLEVMRSINTSLPPMADNLPPNAPPPDAKQLPFDKRKDLKIEYVETQFFPELSVWFNDIVKKAYLDLNPHLGKAPAPGADGSVPVDPAAAAAAPVDPAVAAAAPVDPSMAGTMDGGTAGYGGDPTMMADLTPTVDLSTVTIPPPTGPGWVIELKGHHFYNDRKDRRNTGSLHVINTLIKNLEHGFVDLPLGPGQRTERFSMKELGIGYVILAYNPRPKPDYIPNPSFVQPLDPSGVPGAGGFPGAGGLTPSAGGFGGVTAGVGAAAGGFGGGTAAGASANPADPNAKIDPDNPPFFNPMRYDFAIQFVWREKPINVRLAEREERHKKEQEAKAAAEAAAAAGGETPAPDAAAPPVTAATMPSVGGPAAVPPIQSAATPASLPAAAEGTTPAGGPMPAVGPAPAPGAALPAGSSPAVRPPEAGAPPAGAPTAGAPVIGPAGAPGPGGPALAPPEASSPPAGNSTAGGAAP